MNQNNVQMEQLYIIEMIYSIHVLLIYAIIHNIIIWINIIQIFTLVMMIVVEYIINTQ